MRTFFFFILLLKFILSSPSSPIVLPLPISHNPMTNVSSQMHTLDRTMNTTINPSLHDFENNPCTLHSLVQNHNIAQIDLNYEFHSWQTSSIHLKDYCCNVLQSPISLSCLKSVGIKFPLSLIIFHMKNFILLIALSLRRFLLILNLHVLLWLLKIQIEKMLWQMKLRHLSKITHEPLPLYLMGKNVGREDKILLIEFFTLLKVSQSLMQSMVSNTRANA